MKKSRWAIWGQVLYWVLLVGVTGGFTTLVTLYYNSIPVSYGEKEAELICFGLIVLCWFSLFYAICRWVRRLRWRVPLAVGLTLVSTASIFFLNNFWRYRTFALWESVWGDGYSFDYSYFLEYDLKYSYAWGEYRYPALALLTLAFFLLGVWLLPKAKALLFPEKDRAEQESIEETEQPADASCGAGERDEE